jgi:hypothetical protein
MSLATARPCGGSLIWINCLSAGREKMEEQDLQKCVASAAGIGDL